MNSLPLIRSDDSVLLVMDMQSRLAGAMSPKAWSRVRGSTSLLVNAASVLEIPVILTRHYPEGLGETDPDIDHIMPTYTESVDKTRFSACGSGQFDPILLSTGRRQIVVCGMEAHVCVLQTVSELAAHGYSPYVVSDAVCSRVDENRVQALERMQSSGIRLSNSESTVFEWLRDSKNEHFRSLLEFIK